LGFLAAILVAIQFLLPRLYRGYRPTPRLAVSVVAPMARFSLLNYLTLLFFNAQFYLTPLIVVNRLGPEANAYYFSAVALASPSWAIPLTISLAFLLEEIHGQGRLEINLRRAVIVAASVLVPLIAFLFFGGRYLLLAFGSEYSQQGLGVLRILAFAAVPAVLIDFYIAVQRVRRHMKAPAVLLALVATGGMVGAYFLVGPMGINGAAVSILAANVAGALWALWKLLTAIRHHPQVSLPHLP
jgi:O-antigen/teichoic acid export membrane protein